MTIVKDFITLTQGQKQSGRCLPNQPRAAQALGAAKTQPFTPLTTNIRLGRISIETVSFPEPRVTQHTNNL